MNTIIIASIIAVGVGLGFTGLVLLLKIAGKDIYYAFKRWLFPKGCEVYVASATRNITHQYLVPKDNQFKIDGETYITNPEKTMNLNSEVREEAQEAIQKKKKRLKSRIKKIDGKISGMKEKLKKCEDNRQIQYLKNNIETLKDAKSKLENRLRTKQENYFKNKRPAFFYIKGDPVPKDFYEFYSTLDSQILDNIVSRAISKPPEKNTKEQLDMLKWFIYAAGVGSIVASFLAFKSVSMLQTVCTKVGATCTFP